MSVLLASTQTGQHPPLVAYNALLGAVNEAGSIDHCHLVRRPGCPYVI